MSTQIITFTLTYLNYEYRIYLHPSAKEMRHCCIRQNLDAETVEALAFFCPKDNGNGELHFNKQNIPIGIIVHEISHAVFHQIESQKQTALDGEQYAYTMQGLLEKFLTALDQCDVMPNQYFYKLRFYDLKF